MHPTTALASDAAAWAGTQFRRRALQLVLEKLDAAKIQALPVKGILLAYVLYDDPSQRPMSDVDLLVRWQDFSRVLRTARAAGWPIFRDSRTLGSANFVVDGVVIDVTASVGPPGTSAVGVSEFLKRATSSVDPLGFPHLQIEWHDHTLLMAIDAFKDKLAGKPWARDDLLRLAQSRAFSPEKLVALARSARLETMLWLVADWMSETSSPWNDVQRHLAAHGGRLLYKKAFASRTRQDENKHSSVILALLARVVSDQPARRVGALVFGAMGTTLYSARRFLR